MPESRDDLAADSRWPAFFPSPLSIVTTAHDGVRAVEKLVGATIVNRFPYIMALSFCVEPLSPRHYVRRRFLDLAQASGKVALQLLMPGDKLTALMAAITDIPEDRAEDRFRTAYLPTRPGKHSAAPIFDDAYLVYEGRLVTPGADFDGAGINSTPWHDVGSHRILLFEVTAISLRKEFADQTRQIQWRSLPTWPATVAQSPTRPERILPGENFVKPYQPDYVFPSRDTIAFKADDEAGAFAVRNLPPLPSDQLEVDNDRARWPCFFPSSLGLITVQTSGGCANAMPCGSTAVLARHPMTLAICVSYARINSRYRPRASLALLREAGRFGCGVPVLRADVLAAIRYLGNVSWHDDPAKLENCGLTAIPLGRSLGFRELPIHFDCRIVDEIRLGTHSMFMGQVERIFVRTDLTHETPLEWCPIAGSVPPHAL